MKILYKINDFIDIKISTFLLLLITFLTGQFKPIVIFLILSFIHELGHLIACLIFKVEVKKIVVLPFGFNLQIQDNDYLKSYQNCIIYLAGPMMYFVNFWLITFLYKHQILSYVTYIFAKNANLAVNLFNLLPIYPLDGFRVLNSLFQYPFTYKKTMFISLGISLFFFVLLVIYNFINPQIVITIFLLVMQCLYLKEIPFLYKKFLYYKTANIKHKKFKVIKNYDMYKEYNNYKFEENKILNDREIALKILSSKNKKH